MSYADIVMPRGNEKEFIAIAERLGYSSLCFLYEFDKYKKVDEIVKILKKSNIKTKLKVYSGIITSPKFVQKARNRADLVVVSCCDNIREIVERYKPDLVIDMELQKKRDYMHQRNAGLNHTVCKIANDKKVAFGVSFRSILEQKYKQVLLGRIMQNIRLYKKYKNNFVFASFAKAPYLMRAPHDLASFLTVLGMEPKQAKQALRNVLGIINRNSKIRNKKIIADGVEIVGDA